MIKPQMQQRTARKCKCRSTKRSRGAAEACLAVAAITTAAMMDRSVMANATVGATLSILERVGMSEKAHAALVQSPPVKHVHHMAMVVPAPNVQMK